MGTVFQQIEINSYTIQHTYITLYLMHLMHLILVVR